MPIAPLFGISNNDVQQRESSSLDHAVNAESKMPIGAKIIQWPFPSVGKKWPFAVGGREDTHRASSSMCNLFSVR